MTREGILPSQRKAIAALLFFSSLDRRGKGGEGGDWRERWGAFSDTSAVRRPARLGHCSCMRSALRQGLRERKGAVRKQRHETDHNPAPVLLLSGSPRSTIVQGVRRGRDTGGQAWSRAAHKADSAFSLLL